VTDAFKLRAGVRQDWWDTSLTPRITVPGRFGTDGKPLLAGVEDSRNDAPLSWNIGALYKVFSWMSPYVGVSRSHGDARPPKSISMKKQPMRRLLSEFDKRDGGASAWALANGARAESRACLEREHLTSRSRGAKYLPGIFQLMLLH